MKPLWKTASVLAALSLATISLAGCNTDGIGNTPPVISAGAVDLPAACETLLRQQAVVRAHVGDDYRVLFKRAQAGQIVENNIIAQTRQCLDYQRKLYGGAQ